MPDKTPWDTSIEGTSPSLGLVDFNAKKAGIVTDESEIHAERIRRANEQAAELSHSRYRTGESTFLASAQNRETANRANLELLRSRKRIVLAPPTRKKRRAFHSYELALALYQQGRFAEALTFAKGKQRRFIKRLIEADAKPDDFDCGCEREVVDGVTLCRRFEREPVLSPRLGKVVTVKECSRCGDINIFEGLPERQQKIAMLRAKSPLVDDAQLLKQV